jgi:predicted nucleic acid-binding Zn ribbon protein
MVSSFQSDGQNPHICMSPECREMLQSKRLLKFNYNEANPHIVFLNLLSHSCICLGAEKFKEMERKRKKVSNFYFIIIFFMLLLFLVSNKRMTILSNSAEWLA